MADDKRTSSSSGGGKLAAAGESSDPEVHKLLAERQTAVTNLEAVTPSEGDKDVIEEARRQLAAVDKKLADLGYSAG